ncbi:hypothetical protein [Citrobacter freundii]|uniref:hypothetical protein n=1 Tax=Citrobacter freundii TaxID=546 RepID=UPI0023AF9286|nr:hypothetical protein [Citrobacter freundii]
MQFGKKSKSGLRSFIRNDGTMLISDKKGKARVVIGVLGDDKHVYAVVVLLPSTS